MAMMAEQILSNTMPVRVGITLVVDPAAQAQEAAPGANQEATAAAAPVNHEYEIDNLDLGGHYKCAAPPAAEAADSTAVSLPGPGSLSETVIRLYRYVRRKYENRAALRFLAELYRKRPVLDAATQTFAPLAAEIVMDVFVGYLKLVAKQGPEEALATYKEEVGRYP